MKIIKIDDITDIKLAKYGKNNKTEDVLSLIKNEFTKQEIVLKVCNNTFLCDPCENIVKELYLKINNNFFTIFEGEYITFKLNKAIIDNKFNYYIVIINKDLEEMIDFYFIYLKYIINKCGHNFIKVYGNDILTKIKYTKNNVIILYKCFFDDNDVLFLKKQSHKIYFLNVEQLTILVDNNLSQLEKEIKDFLIKSIKFISKHNISLIDYSYENKKLWNDKYHINNVIVLEPCLNNYMIYDKSKTIDFISLFNHISYRHNFLNSYLKDLEIKSFSGYYCNKRRQLFSESKILLNIHAGVNYKICELFRIYEAISHKIIIISQNGFNNNLISLNKFIIFSEDNNYNDVCKNTIKNYNNIYSNLYENENVNNIFKNIELKYKSFFSNTIDHLI